MDDFLVHFNDMCSNNEMIHMYSNSLLNMIKDSYNTREALLKFIWEQESESDLDDNNQVVHN